MNLRLSFLTTNNYGDITLLISKLSNLLRKKNNDTTGFYQVTATYQMRNLSSIYEQYFGEIVNGTFMEVNDDYW